LKGTLSLLPGNIEVFGGSREARFIAPQDDPQEMFPFSIEIKLSADVIIPQSYIRSQRYPYSLR